MWNMEEYNIMIDELAEIKLLNQQILELVEEQSNTLREIEKVIDYLPLEEDDVKYPDFDMEDNSCNCDNDCIKSAKLYSLNIDDDDFESICDALKNIESSDNAKEYDLDTHDEEFLHQLFELNMKLDKIINRM